MNRPGGGRCGRRSWRIEKVSPNACVDLPTLTIFGSLDDHFADPAAEAAATASELRGDQMVVEGAGHYPHVEYPEAVAAAIASFVAALD